MSFGIDSAAAFINVLGVLGIELTSVSGCSLRLTDIPFFLGPGPCSSSKTQTVSSQKYITFLTRTPVWFFRAKALLPWSRLLISFLFCCCNKYHAQEQFREKDDWPTVPEGLSSSCWRQLGMGQHLADHVLIRIQEPGSVSRKWNKALNPQSLPQWQSSSNKTAPPKGSTTSTNSVASYAASEPVGDISSLNHHIHLCSWFV